MSNTPSGLRGLRVLVVGTDPRTGPRAIPSLRAAGCTVIAADRDGAGNLHGRTLASPKVERHPNPLDDPAGMARWVEQAARRHGVDVVLPLSEDATRVLALQEVDLGAATLNGPNRHQYATLADKLTLARTAEAAGVGTPTTIEVPPGTVIPDLPLPAVVKSTDSTGVDDIPTGIKVVHTREELEQAVADLHAGGSPVVIQEFVDGDQWSAHIVRDAHQWAGLSAIVRLRSPRGAGTPSILEVTPREDVRTQAVKLLEAIDYRGCANIQFIDRDGELCVHDVNLRSPATVHMPISAGLDMPALGMAAALGIPWEAPTRFEHITYLWLEAEIKEALRSGNPLPGLLRTARMMPRRGVVIDPNPLDPYTLVRKAMKVRKLLPF